jgi:hypothetical protein
MRFLMTWRQITEQKGLCKPKSKEQKNMIAPVTDVDVIRQLWDVDPEDWVCWRDQLTAPTPAKGEGSRQWRP